MTHPEVGQKHDGITCQIFKGVSFFDWHRLGLRLLY